MGNCTAPAAVPANAPRIIIVGGGIAGTTIAKALDSSAFVTLITPLNFMQHKFGLLRAQVVPGWERTATVPLSRLLYNGKITQGTVTSVSEGSVTLSDGTSLSADYIILAHGGSTTILPTSAPPGVIDATDFQTLLVEKQKLIREAKKIAIIGAGPVGLELAGEIRAQYPTDKTITVIQSQSQILNNSSPPLIEKAIVALNEQLHALNITVLLNTRVTNLPTTLSDGFITNLTTLELSNEQTLETDLTIVCIGTRDTTSTTTSLLPSSTVYDETHRIKVDLTFRVEGMQKVYCIGDASNIPETKMGYFAERHALALAENLKKMQAGLEPVAYIPATATTAEYGVMFVPLGPEQGVGAMGTNVMGGALVSMIKGKGLFKQKVFNSRNVPPPTI
jgi:apoptosis-inducing factor 2